MAISNGLGLEKLREMIKYQEGNDQVIDDYSILPIANERIDLEYESDENVYVETIDALMIGEAAMLLGAGRATIDDKIDLGVGIVLNKKVGDKISKGDILATIYTNGQNTEQAIQMVLDSYLMSDKTILPREITVSYTHLTLPTNSRV